MNQVEDDQDLTMAARTRRAMMMKMMMRKMRRKVTETLEERNRRGSA